MPYPFFLIDAFVSEVSGSGNSAGVVLLDGEHVWPPERQMQEIATEVNQAETAFLLKEGHDYGLRWFTPVAEVDLCGHATVAATTALESAGRLGDNVTFHTRSGPLHCSVSAGQVTLDFPAQPVQATDAPAQMNGLENANFWGTNGTDWLVALPLEEEVKRFQPDFEQIVNVGMRGIIVTAQSNDPRYDFISRFFAPAFGVPEDHVTGSAHCALAPFWAERLAKADLVGFQASRRGGIVGTSVQGDRVLLTGLSRVRASGVWHVDSSQQIL